MSNKEDILRKLDEALKSMSRRGGLLLLDNLMEELKARADAIEEDLEDDE